LLAQFSNRREDAVRRYVQFVEEGVNQASIWKNLNRQVFLGGDHFVTRMQDKIKGLSEDINIPKVQRRPPAPPLAEITKTHDSRNPAIFAAYATGEYSYQQIANFFNLHFTTVGKIVRAERAERKKHRQ
jgi:REP-associated tyrosine transposase